MIPREDRVTINKEFASVDSFINEYVVNVSRSGAFIRSKTPLPVGTMVNLKFTIIMEDLETIEGIGEVVRVTRGGMGVVFTKLSVHSHALLAKLMIKHAPTMLAPSKRR